MNTKPLKLAAYGAAIGLAVGATLAYLRDRQAQRQAAWFYGGMSGRDFRQITDTRVSGREVRELRLQPDELYPFLS